jgi:hypothetical protein
MDKSKKLSALRQFFITLIVLGTFAGSIAAFNYAFRDGLPFQEYGHQIGEIIAITIAAVITAGLFAICTYLIYCSIKRKGFGGFLADCVEGFFDTFGLLLVIVGVVGFIVASIVVAMVAAAVVGPIAPMTIVIILLCAILLVLVSQSQRR